MSGTTAVAVLFVLVYLVVAVKILARRGRRKAIEKQADDIDLRQAP